jgi:hypothetical protein
MKGAFCAFALASLLSSCTVSAAVAPVITGPAKKCGPVAKVEPVVVAPKLCLDKADACTTKPTGCCEGLVCSGYSFYKKCVEPPVCLAMWHDCKALKTPCCGGTKCTIMDNGNYECQTPKIGTRTVEIGVFDVKLTSAPTPAPKRPNLKVTKVPGVPVKLNIACSTGDPHSKYPHLN